MNKRSRLGIRWSVGVLATLCAWPAPMAHAQTMAEAGAPFGMLPLIDEINVGDPADPHPFVEVPTGASRIESVLGRNARVLAPSTDSARHFAYRIGAGRGLVAGRAYLLVVDYPDDAPRTIAILQRGADQVRTISTGQAIGDYREQYTSSNVESLRYPHSGQYQQYRVLFYLHDRFMNLTGVRNDSDARRPNTPAQGFWVSIGQFSQRGNPRERGAAASRIRLFEVSDPSRFDQEIHYPPEGLPRRHTFWREEMNDGTAMCLSGNSGACEGATADPVTWLEYKMRLARFLGMNTFAWNLLEFGFNQGWDPSAHGGSDWYIGSRIPNLWSDAVRRAGALGLEVLPYFEYYGALGSQAFSTTACSGENAAGHAQCAAANSGDTRYRCARQYMGSTSQLRCALPTLGYQRNCHPLNDRDNYTGFGWLEDRCIDVSDPAALTDLRNLLDSTVLRLRSQARFAGAWFRTRYSSWPVSFAPGALGRFAMEANGGAAVTRAQLRADPALLDRYYSWWRGKRRALLVALRDQLRGNGLPDATIYFTAYHEEPLPTRFNMDVVATDDVAGWSAINTSGAPFQWRYNPVSWTDFVGDHRYARALTEMTGAQGIAESMLSYAGEFLHSAPPADPDAYQSIAGVQMTMPFGRQFSVADSALMQRFRSQSGLAMVHHFPLNEDDGTGDDAHDRAQGSFNNWPMSGRWGYMVSDVDRNGAFSMLAEARAVANGDPTSIGYLSSNSFNRGAPEIVRAFNAAFLALPALASRVVAGASTDPEVVVREITTPSSGTYYAVVNTSFASKSGVSLTLPAAGPALNLVTQLAQPTAALSFYPGQLLALRVGGSAAPTDAGVEPDASSASDASLPADANVASDGAMLADASTITDSGATRDATGDADGAQPPPTPTGCACRATPQHAPPRTLLLWGALGLALARARRRAKRL